MSMAAGPSDRPQADQLLQDYIPTPAHVQGRLRVVDPVTQERRLPRRQPSPEDGEARDWQLSGIWNANTGTAYTVGPSFQNGARNQNITGSPDYGGRVRVVGNPGSGCSSDIYSQCSTSAFAPKQVGSVGLESGADYLRGCF
jgi:hypothetical protein